MQSCLQCIPADSAESAAILDRTLQKWYTDIAEGESNSKICAIQTLPAYR